MIEEEDAQKKESTIPWNLKIKSESFYRFGKKTNLIQAEYRLCPKNRLLKNTVFRSNYGNSSGIGDYFFHANREKSTFAEFSYSSGMGPIPLEYGRRERAHRKTDEI
jgi:hypothetical protein